MTEPNPRQLLEKLVGKRILLSTRCGSMQQTDGYIQQVFTQFILFQTKDERAQEDVVLRHWVWMDNIGVITEAPRVAEESIDIER